MPVVVLLGGAVYTFLSFCCIIAAYEVGWDDGRKKLMEDDLLFLTKAEVDAIAKAVKEES